MRPRPTLLRLWSRRLAADRPLPHGAERRTFSFTQRTALSSGGLGGGGHSWSRNPRTRPQLPFLVVPSASTTVPATATRTPRYFTTQRRRWLRYEALAFVKYTLYFWAAVSCLVLGQFVVQQEWMERAHPTPPEWTFMSRMRLRGALSERGEVDGAEEQGAAQTQSSEGGSMTTATHVVDHVKVMQILLDLLERLENPAIDGGNGLVVADVDGNVDGNVDGLLSGKSAAQPTGKADDVADNVPGVALDIRAKSEPWRRGYYETLLAAAATAEHVDGWLRDRTRNLVCAPDIVVGPSNPNPRPLPPGASGAPREEDCESCFPAPAELYLKLLRTRGLTTRQQITAALAFANYLEYKQDRDAAAYVYGRAVLASRGPGSEELPLLPENDSRTFFDLDAGVDATAWIKAWTAQNHAVNHQDETTAPTYISRNLLATLTAYATFQARSGDVAAALPLFVSLLQARRSLPPSSSSSLLSSAATTNTSSRAKPAGIVDQLIALLTPPGYPPPPDDGFSPPLPGARAICEEAALRLHIGEIIYASAARTSTGTGAAASSSSSSSSWMIFSSSTPQQQAREEGIAWTREAVDMAEEQLHALAQNGQQQQDKNQNEQNEQGRKGGGMANALSQVVATATTGSSTTLTAAAADGSATCRQCLVAGLDNWTAMVAQLARDEQQRQQKMAADYNGSSSSSASWWPSWLSLWGDGGGSVPPPPTATTASTAVDPTPVKKLGRWAAEERVIQDRRRRARELMDDAAPPPRGFMALFTA